MVTVLYYRIEEKVCLFLKKMELMGRYIHTCMNIATYSWRHACTVFQCVLKQTACKIGCTLKHV